VRDERVRWKDWLRRCGVQPQPQQRRALVDAS
jgi:hypothetical protein